MTIAFIHFMMNLIIAGFILRSATAYLVSKDSAFGKALAFIY